MDRSAREDRSRRPHRRNDHQHHPNANLVLGPQISAPKNSLGAGVTPAQGSVKPTAGFTSNKVIYPSPDQARPVSRARSSTPSKIRTATASTSIPPAPAAPAPSRVAAS